MGDNNRTLMLATFANDESLDKTIKRIFGAFIIENNKLFVFLDFDKPDKKIITYNVISENGTKIDIKCVKNTIRINRKKESNTLYTINSINKIIEEEGGTKDKNYMLQWQNYKNCLLLLDKEFNEVSITKTKLYHIIEKDEFNKNRTAIINKNPQYI